jgi:cell wall-associated NlpC family hydrolase
MKNFWLNKSVAILGLACMTASCGKAQQAQQTVPGAVLTGFVNHGIAAKVSESRGIMAIRDKAGTPLIVAIARDHYAESPRSSLLVIDAKTGKAQQYWYPVRENASGDVFSLLRAPEGKIYTTMGHTLLEFDLEKREWTFNGPTDGMAMAFARTPDGNVFFGTYPHSSLYRFDPKSRKLEKLIQLDPQEQYPQYLAAGADGWVYAGMGTARGNIVAYNPQTGELKQLVNEASRKLGTSYVWAATDGNLYGREFSAESGRLLKLEGGTATPVEGNPANPQRAVTGGLNWGNMLSAFPTGGGAIASFSVPDKYAEVVLDGKKQRITFDYESNGPSISSLVVGPDSKVYGSTNHPMHFFAFDPTQKAIVDYGGIPQVASGNFPAFAVSGKYLVGDSYAAGAVYELDTTQPWNVPATGDSINPRMLGKYNDVTRPRAAVALPNGDVLFGGYGGYGVTGGGLVKYSAATREAAAKPAADLLPNHSTIALALLNDKTVVGGTTIEAMGGGRVLATEAELYLLDIATQTVAFRTVPIPGARSITSLHVTADGKVYGLTSDAKFFMFDPQTKTVVHRADWSKWGHALNPGNSLWRTPSGRVGVLLSKTILEVQPDYSARKLADLPASANAGGVVLNNRLYFATGSELQSISLAPLGQ